MDLSARMLRWAGWLCVCTVATLTSLGYHFGNIRFAPMAAGFAILAVVFLRERRPAPMRNDGIHPRRDSGIDRASR